METSSWPDAKTQATQDGTWYADDWITNEANEYFRQRAAL